MDDAVKQNVAPARYGVGAVTFHWTVAALIVFLGGLGLRSTTFPRTRARSGSTSTSASA